MQQVTIGTLTAVTSTTKTYAVIIQISSYALCRWRVNQYYVERSNSTISITYLDTSIWREIVYALPTIAIIPVRTAIEDCLRHGMHAAAYPEQFSNTIIIDLQAQYLHVLIAPDRLVR